MKNGKIVQVMGPVIDVEFEDELPKIKDALEAVSYTHLCTKFKVPAFLGSSFAFLGGFYTVANLDSGCLLYTSRCV